MPEVLLPGTSTDSAGCILVGKNKEKGKVLESRATSDALNEILKKDECIRIPRKCGTSCSLGRTRLNLGEYSIVTLYSPKIFLRYSGRPGKRTSGILSEHA